MCREKNCPSHARHAGRKGRFLIAFIVGLGFAAESHDARAQWGYMTEINAAYSSNPVGIHDAGSSSVLTIGGGLDWTSRILNVGYLGRYARYNEFGDLDGYTHQGFVALGGHALGVSFDGEQRLSGGSRIYDYRALSASASAQFDLFGIRWSVMAGGRLYDFRELSNRNQRSVHGALRAAKSFKTRTTLIVTAGGGLAEYTSDAGSGSLAERPVVNQWNGTMRVAQSLSMTTGLAVQYQIRRLAGETPAAYMIEEEGVSYAVLDDPSLYSLESYGVELTQMAFDYRMTLKAGANYGERDYLTQGSYVDALSYDVDDPRCDTYYSFYLKAAYDIRLPARSVSLELGAQWMKNRSSSYWYAFDDSYLSLGIGYNF